MITLEVIDGTKMGAYVSYPKGSGNFPAVIVFQEAYGVNCHIKDVADRIAAEGYIAIAPELFHRTAPMGYDPGYGDFSVVMPHFQALTLDNMIDDAQAAYNWLMQQDNVVKDKIGCIGFCLGGRVSFIANSALPLAAAVSFYGGYTHTVADRAATISCPLLLFWAGQDNHIFPEHIQTVLGALSKAGKQFTNVEFSNAPHAFFCNDRPSYNEEAATESWGMVKVFFNNKLKK